ncbi:MAG: hypothetical protein Q4A79_03330 [Candidatus Saccharibacteria bacterium]|nr:hypothetical protein [Candidatus Saccharibacteria bacterium]
MRVICLFRDERDYTRSITDWLEDFYRQTGHEIEVMDPDENPNFCEAYDVVDFPTIIVLNDNGSVNASWSGTNLPLINEVLYYIM